MTTFAALCNERRILQRSRAAEAAAGPLAKKDCRVSTNFAIEQAQQAGHYSTLAPG